MFFKWILSGIAIVTLAGCATSQKFSIRSNPEGAKVTAEMSSGESKTLGVTPLDMNSQDIFSAKSGMSHLHIEKEGFQSQKVFISSDSSRENFEISIKLKEIAHNPQIQNLKDSQEQLAKSFATISSHINSKRFEEAERQLLNLVDKYPYISVSYDLLGNISYLRRDFRAALNYYKRSLSLNPQNVETKQMIDRLSGMIN